MSIRDLDLTTLRLFVAACELRNMARAGEQEHIGASAISKRLALLEAQVGAPLLERHRRGVVPTAAGEILLEHARALLATADRVARDMTAYRHGVKGQVRVLASMSSITESLPDDIAAFLARPEHAQIRVDIEERTSSAIVQALREGLAPVGVCWDAADLEGLQTRPYRTDELVLVIPSEHPLARRKAVKLREALAYDFVGAHPGSAINNQLTQAAAQAGLPLKLRIQVTSYDALCLMVNAGLGVGVMPRGSAALYKGTLGIRTITLNEPWAHRHLKLCVRSEESLSSVARLLVDHLRMP